MRNKVSDTVVDISNRLESEVGLALQSLASKILPRYVEYAPVLLTDGVGESAGMGNIPVRFEQSENFVEVSKPNAQSSEPASLETLPEPDVKTPDQSIIAGQFTEQQPGLKKKIFGEKNSSSEDQQSNSDKGSKKHHWIPAAIVALIILSVGGLTWAVVSRLNANSSNIQATINALQKVQLQNLTRNKYWQLNVHNMITNQLKAEDTTTKNLTVTGKATINDLFAKLGQINTLSTNGLTSANINGGSITANNLQAGNTNTTNLVVTGATTLGGPITINGTTTLADLVANGQLKLTGNENDLILLQPTQDNGQSVFTVRNTSGAALVTIDTNGNLTLASNATIGGVLTVPTANITTDNVTNSNINTATIGTLTATGASTFDGNIHALSDAQIDGTLGVNGATQLNSTLNVAGATTLSSTLAVTGATTLTGQLNANGGIVTNNASINAGSGAITSGLINGQTISNAANFTGSLNVAGNFSVNTNKFTVDSATGNTAVAGTLDVNGASALNGTLGVTGATTLGNNLAVNGNTTLGLNSTNTVSINGRLNTDIIPIGNQVQSIGSNTNFLDNLYVANLFANNVNAGGTQISGTQSTTFTINSSNSTADTQDSSLVFDRGTVAPNATLTWDSTLKQLEFNQPVAITSGGLSLNSGNLSVNGSQTISGTLQVTGATTLGSIQTNGPINGQTISNASQFTGTVAVQGANALTLGLSSTNTGAIQFKGSGSNNTLTLQGPSAPSTNTLTLPNETGTLCSTGSVCAGYAPSSGSGNYIQNGSTPQTANFNITGNGTIGGTVKFSSLGTGVLHSSSLGVISSSAVVLGTDTSGSYVSNLGTLTGLTTAGNSGAGSTPSLSVTYGSLANTAVQGNTTLTCPSGTGNLSGTGNTITLGTGGTCNSLTIVNSPIFSGTVQGNIVNATSALELGGANINTAGTLSNVAYLNGTGPQTFTGNNKFTGTLLAQNASDSTAAFQIQNAAGTSNLLVADTTDSRIGIGTASPNTNLTVYNPNASTTQTNFTQSLTNGGINIVTNYVSNAYTPGLFFSTADNNPTEPKAGIYLQETNTGSSLLFGTSNTYTAGITNTALTINQSGGAVFRDSNNSTTEYQFQNASGLSALTVDTTNNIVDTAQLEVDTLGSTGTSVVCYNASRLLSSCGGTVGSGSYIFNGTSLQTANFNIQSANPANPAGIVEAASGQTADTFQVANSSGSPIAELGSLGTNNSFFSGAVQTNNSLQLATNSLTTGYVSKQFKAGTGGVTNNDVVILLNDGGLVAEDTPTARNPAVYGVATQTVSAGSNVNIAFSGEYQVTATSPAVNIGDQLVTSTTNGEVVTDNNATTGILGIATSSKSAGSPGLVDVMIRPVGGVSTPTFSPQSDSTTAFRIQNANQSTTLFDANTTNSRIAINQASANYTLDVNGDINTTGIYRVGGIQISSSNLSDQSNIALLNRNSQVFTGNNQSFENASNSTTAFQVQNSSGTSILNVDSSNSIVTVRGANSDATTGSNLVTITDFCNAAWTTTNWTLNPVCPGPATTAVHVTGNTSALSTNQITFAANTTYAIFACYSSNTNAGATITVNAGGTSGLALVTPSGFPCGSQVITTGSSPTNVLSFTPSSTWIGSIGNVSVSVLTGSNSAITVQNSSGGNALEIRSNDSAQTTIIGLSAGQYLGNGFTGTTALGAAAMQNAGVNIGSGLPSNDTAIGATALQNDNTGGNNTGVGYEALQSLTVSSFVAPGDTALGAFSLQKTTTGAQNTGLGTNSLLNNTSGSSNTAVGYNAGLAITTGSNNTFLGTSSNASSGSLSNSTAIGTFAQVNQSNSLVLGCVDGTNSCTTNTKVGVDNTTPGYTLDVAGDIHSAGSLVVGGGGQILNLSTPNAPTITQGGTAGSTHYSYAIAALNAAGGSTPISTATQTITGNATLNSTNFNKVTWTPVAGVVKYEIFRTASSGTPSTTGLIGTVNGNEAAVSQTFNDTGIAGSEAAPSVDTSGQLNVSESIVDTLGAACISAVASSSGGSLATNTYFYEITALDGSGGESSPACEMSSPVTGPNGSVTISWVSFVPGATAYRIYRGTSAGLENVYYTATSSPFVDTGAAGTSASPPAISNAYSMKLNPTGNSWFDGGNLGVGTASPGQTLSVLGTTLLQSAAGNSTTAFQIQNNANNSNLFVADTTNTKIGIATAPTAGGATLQVNGDISLTTLDTANTSTYLCRNSSNQIANCSTTVSGSAFVQGGNNFGAQAVLGTNDSNNLALETNGTNKVILDTSGNLTFQQASTISNSSAATGTQLTIRGGASTSGTNVGGNLLLEGGAGASTGASGSVIVQSNTNNSTTAFQIQNNNANSLLTADTSNMQLNVGNVQSTGTIAVQGPDGGSVLIGAVVNSGNSGMTFSGNEITDITRAAGIQGDGEAPPQSATGIWDSATNLTTNGGFETNTTGYSLNDPSSSITWARSTAAAKFGGASVKLSNTTAGEDGYIQTSTINVSASTTYTATAWINASGFTAAASGNRALMAVDQVPTALGNTTITSASNGWIKETLTFTTLSGSTSVRLRLYAPQGTVYWDGVQLEQKTIATPYVDTNGGTASRNAAEVTAPSSSVTATQGWVAMRLRPGFASSYSSTSADNKAFFSLNDGTANNRVSAIYLPANQKIEMASVNGGTGIFPNVTPSTSWSAGSFDTFVFAWTSTTLQLSVNGGAFQTVSSSRTNIASTITQLEIGSNVSSIRLDSDVLWAAAGSGTLTNADAVSLNALGNSDPSISGLNTIDTSSTPNFAWNGEGTAYSGTNNTATLQSGITLDDTNIYHSSNGSIAIQGSVNSATAFQIQNASGTSDLTVSTTNGQVAVGAAAVPANGVLTVGTNTTTASGGIYFGTDSNLYRSAASTLQTDSAFIVQPTGNPTQSFKVGPTISTSTTNAQLIVANGTFTGSGTGPEGISVSPTFTPSATISVAYGSVVIPTANPGSGVTITTLNGSYGRISTGNGTGAVTTANDFLADSPTLGTLLPGTINGVNVQNQGVASVGTAIGLNVAAQSGATTDIGVKIAASTTYALQLADTGGAANGGIEFGTDTDLYRAGAGALKTDNNLSIGCSTLTRKFCVAANTTTPAALIDQTGTGDVLDLTITGNTTTVASVTKSGATTFENAVNSTTAFQIQNSSANSLLTADTSNMQLNVGNVQSSGTIAIQGPDGGSVLIGAIANSGTGSSAMTFSGNEITDLTRGTAIQGDGRQPPDSSTGVWETTTNLVRNGGLETNSTDWVEALGTGATGSISRITSDSKFGRAGADFTITNVGTFNVFENNYFNYHTAPYFNTSAQYTMSFWAKLASGSSSWRAAIMDGSATNTVMPLTAFTPTTTWKKFSFTFTPQQAGNQPVLYFALNSGTASDLHMDGVQVEQLPQSTPYVDTNGATITRNAARVQAPTAVTNMSQGWFAERVRMGGSSTNTQAYTLGNVQIDANDYLSLAATGSTWQISNVNGGTTDSSSSSTSAYSAGTMVTAVFSWTSTTLNISINGSTFATATRVSVPAGSLTSFDIGSQAGINQLDGDVLWTAAGTGTLTNADATTLNALGNSDPSVSSLTSMDSAAIPTFAWNGEGSAYTGSNNSLTVQSGITLDDASLYRGAANTLESNSYLLLQPTTDSTTAYQINNAANTASVFDVDTVNKRIGLGTNAPNAKLDVEVSGSIGQIINQTSSNDILDLQNTGTNVVQVTNTGATLFKNSANSTTAFQILDSANTNLLTANTNTDTLTVDNLSVTGTCTGCGAAGTVSLQSAYTTGNTITTSGGNNINFQLANGNFVVQNAVGTDNTDNLFNINGTYNANNLITNGSFEVDTVGWAAKQAGAASIAMTQTTGISNTPFGSGVMQVVSSGTITASDFDGVKWPITLSTNTTYTFSFYAKLSSGTFTAVSFGRQADNGSGDTACSSTGSASTTDWKRFACSFTTGASFTGGGGTYVFIGQNDTTARTYYIDGVSLEKSPATSASFYKEGTLNLQGLALGNVLIQPTANTNATFEVASVNGTNGLLIDTDGSNISTGFAFTANSSTTDNVTSTSALAVRNATSLAPLLKLDTTNVNNSDTNGSFENSTTTATNYSNNHAGATISVDTTASNAFEGSNTGKEVTTASAVANSGVKYNLTTTTMASTTTYTLSFYAKLVAGQSAFTTLTAGRAEDGSTETACTLNNATVTFQWQNYTCTFKTGTTSGTPYFYIGQTDAGTAHQYYLDGVQFTTASSITANYHEGNIQLNGVITSPVNIQSQSDSEGVFQLQNAEGNNILSVDSNTGNLVTNSGFENGGGFWSAKGTATVSTDSTAGNVYQGDQALKSVVTAASSGMTTSTFTSTIGTGTQYQLTFYAKCDNTYNTFTYGRQDVSGTDVNSTTSATCNTNWQQYTAHWTTGGTITNPDIYMNLGSTTSGTIWVDDVQLVQTNTSAATNYNTGNILIGGVITSPVIFQNTSNSTTAFQVQNTSGTDVFSIDTQNQRVGVGTNAPGNLLSIGALTTAAGTYQVAVSTGGVTNSGIVVQTVASQSSGYVFQAQNSSGSLLAGIDYQGNLTVQNATITGVLTINGHVVTGNSTGSTSATVNGNAGSGSSCSVSGNDTAGQITLTTGTASWASGIQCTINFANNFASAPHPVTTNATNINTGSVVVYVNSATNNFTVNFVNADTAQHTYVWNYFNAQ